MKKSDIIAGAAAGFLIALLAIAVLANLSVRLDALRWALLVIAPVIVIVGLWIASRLSRFWQPTWQIAKFVVTGALNTLVDFGVLNLLIYLTGIAAGLMFSVFKGASFLVAVVNSYFWNKFWTFQKKETEGAGKEFIAFFAVSTMTFLLNVGAASFLVNVVGPVADIDPKIWANVGAASAGLVSFAANFFGYKFFVFRR